MERGQGAKSAVQEVRESTAIPVIAIATLDDLMGSSPGSRRSSAHGAAVEAYRARVRRELTANAAGAEHAAEWDEARRGRCESNGARNRTMGTTRRRRRRSRSARYRVLLVGADRAARGFVGTGAGARRNVQVGRRKGVVHYSDKLPPEAVDKASVELNKQGMPVKKTDKALTPEQRQGEGAGGGARSARSQGSRRKSRAAIARCSPRTPARRRSTSRAIARCKRSTTSSDRRRPTASSSTSARRMPRPRRANAGKPVVAGARPRAREHRGRARAAVRADRAEEARERRRCIAKYEADKQRWRELVAARGDARQAATATAGCDAPTAAPGKK